jgi:colanic acid biosynthesis glycosyl transferase WcaI
LRLLFLGLNYAPELTGIGKYSGEMMEWLATRGHEVRVVTAPPYYPSWRVSEGYSAFKYSKEVSAAGVEIYRCPLWVPRRPTGLKRVFHLSSFAISSLPIMLAQVAWRPDLVLTVEPAFACAPVALTTARLCGAPAWLHIQDFEVDTAFDLGLLPAGGLVQRFAQWCELFLRRQFSQFSTISRKMLERLPAKGVEASQTVFFPNWVNPEEIYPKENPSPLREQLGISPDQIVLLYSGNLGMKQGLEILPRLARRLGGRRDLHFVFCGDGAYRLQLKEAVSDCANVSMLPLQPPERLNDLLNIADIHLLPQKAGTANLVMPSKLTGMLASGRPIIATAAPDTQIADAVQGRGIAVPPDDVEAFAQSAILLAENSALRQRLGGAARVFAEQELARDLVLLQFEGAIEGMRASTPVPGVPENSTLS